VWFAYCFCQKKQQLNYLTVRYATEVKFGKVNSRGLSVRKALHKPEYLLWHFLASNATLLVSLMFVTDYGEWEFALLLQGFY